MNEEIIELIEQINYHKNPHLSEEYKKNFMNRINEIRKTTMKMSTFYFITSSLFINQILKTRLFISIGTGLFLTVLFTKHQSDKMFSKLHKQFYVSDKLNLIKNK